MKQEAHCCALGLAELAILELLEEAVVVRDGRGGDMDAVEEAKRGREGVRQSLGVTAGQSVNHRVQLPWAIFHGEVEAEQLADPLMLLHGGGAGRARTSG